MTSNGSGKKSNDKHTSNPVVIEGYQVFKESEDQSGAKAVVKEEPWDSGYEGATQTNTQRLTETSLCQPSVGDSVSVRNQLKQLLETTGKEQIVKNVAEDMVQKNEIILEQTDAQPFEPHHSSDKPKVTGPGNLLVTFQYEDPTAFCIPEHITNTNEALVEVDVIGTDTGTDIELVCAVSSKLVLFLHQGQSLQVDVTFYWCNFCKFKSDKKEAYLEHLSEHRFKCKQCRHQSFTRAAIMKHRIQCHPTSAHRLKNFKFCSYLPDVLRRHNPQKRKMCYSESNDDTPSMKKTCVNPQNMESHFTNEIEVVEASDSVLQHQVATSKPQPARSNVVPVSTGGLPQIANVMSGEPAISAATGSNSSKPDCYSCTQCKYTTYTTEHMKTHLLLCHKGLVIYAVDLRALNFCQPNSYVFFCMSSRCSFETRMPPEYLDHLESCTHMRDSSSDNLLVESVEKTKQFVLHFQENYNTSIPTFSCIYCSHVSKSKYRLKGHILADHTKRACVFKAVLTGTQIFFCKYCMADMTDEGKLKKHLREVHKNLPCSTTATTTSAYDSDIGNTEQTTNEKDKMDDDQRQFDVSLSQMQIMQEMEFTADLVDNAHTQDKSTTYIIEDMDSEVGDAGSQESTLSANKQDQQTDSPPPPAIIKSVEDQRKLTTLESAKTRTAELISENEEASCTSSELVLPETSAPLNPHMTSLSEPQSTSKAQLPTSPSPTNTSPRVPDSLETIESDIPSPVVNNDSRIQTDSPVPLFISPAHPDQQTSFTQDPSLPQTSPDAFQPFNPTFNFDFQGDSASDGLTKQSTQPTVDCSKCMSLIGNLIKRVKNLEQKVESFTTTNNSSDDRKLETQQVPVSPSTQTLNSAVTSEFIDTLLESDRKHSHKNYFADGCTKVELVPGYGVKIRIEDLESCLRKGKDSGTAVARLLCDVFFSHDTLSTSCVRGTKSRPRLDSTIIDAIIAYVYQKWNISEKDCVQALNQKCTDVRKSAQKAKCSPNT